LCWQALIFPEVFYRKAADATTTKPQTTKWAQLDPDSVITDELA